MSHTDIPIQPYKQIESMKKYLLSYTPITKVKPDQELMYAAYDFDVALRIIRN